MKQYKFWILISVIFATAILLTLFAAPNSNKFLAGSTFGKSPNGYGAWYEYMIDRGARIERWQKPFSELKDSKNQTVFLKILPPQTKKSYVLSRAETTWIKKGNTIVVLGIDAPATEANFKTTQSYKDLNIEIDTTRRKESLTNTILQDDYGSIVWYKTIGKGKIIYAVTPYIAANAYQDNLDNYEFLAELVNQNSRILVDEYLHGYKDREAIEIEKQTAGNNTLKYFSKTVWLPITIQVIIIMIVASASNLRRFGQPTRLEQVSVDNSQAYIQALGAVLEKAECANFVIKTIAKDERSQLQSSLGLGKGNISDEILLNRWQQLREKNSQQLEKLLKFTHSNSRFNDAQLLQWLQQWQQFVKEKK